MARNRVYIATSLDGFIAGPNDDISWLFEGPQEDARALSPQALHFDEFLQACGAMVMGRRTWEVVSAMDQWFYGELPILVATRRPLHTTQPTVQAAQGSVQELLAQARAIAGDRDVYVDGGDIIRQATLAGLIDEFVITQIPTLLGQGIPLFAGLPERRRLRITSSIPYGSRALQIVAVPDREA
jgi:dihydrofolate reductase